MTSGQGSRVRMKAEFKPLLSAVTISIEMDRFLVSSSPRLEVSNNLIQLFTKNWKATFSIKNLILKPSSCRNLRWISSHELQFTLVASWCHEPSACGDAGSSMDVEGDECENFEPFNQDHLVARIKKYHPHCYCAGCGAQILDSQCQFKRILPLPSENWSDFADIWFCHNHEHNHANGDRSDLLPKTESKCGENTCPERLKNVRNNGIQPRIDDCLVGSLYMMVSARQVNPSAVSCSGDRLLCKRCGNFLGFVKVGEADSTGQTIQSYLSDPLNGVYKIYFHTVSFGEEGRNVGPRMMKVPQSIPLQNGLNSSQEQSVEDFICGLLKDQSKAFTSFRFILHSSPSTKKGQSGLDILIWLLDQELYLYNSTSQISSTSVGRLKSCKSSSSSSSSAGPLPKAVKMDHRGVSHVNLQPKRHMKVLYKADFWPANGHKHTTSSEVIKSWQKDNTVHGLSLPHPLCEQILKLLMNSTAQLNRHQRSLNGFNVGYIRAS